MVWNLLYLLDIFAIGVFVVSYYRNCYRRGYRIDFWHTQLFLIVVLPTLVMLPFARSPLNALILGTDQAGVMAVLPQVFLISLAGAFATVVGGSLWRLRAGIGLRRAAVSLLDIVPRCSMMLMSSRTVLVFHTVLCLLLQMVVLAIYFAGNGFGFDLRAFTFANPTLRPVAQLVSFYSVLIASHCLARYVEKKERVLLGCTLCLTLGMVFFGERSNLLNIYLNVLLCYLVQLRTRVSLIRIAGTGFFIGAGALYLGSVRAGNYSISEFFKAFAGLVLFGNTFSDLRDFGWVYARWDHVFWAGKTYLAALMSFIPRFASTFRDTWGLGVATSSTVGFDPQVHPGLRPGSFGESFFNFGVPGVLVVGLMLGIILRRLDIEVKKALAGPRPSMMEAFAATMLMSVAGCLTLSVNVSELYVLLGLYGFSWICLRVQQLFRVQGSAVVEPG